MKRSFLIRLALVLLVCTATLPAQTYKVLYNFGAHTGDPSNPRYSGVISQGRHGYLYSSADDFWTDAIGSAFSLTTQGQLTVLHRFNITDGEAPVGGLSLGKDGFYYGTTVFGGDAGFGTIFNMRADNGGVGTLYSFSGGDDGAYPNAPPVQSIGGGFFGTTVGTSDSHGSVYKITASGVFSLLHVFSGSDGSAPYAPLVQAANGDFYGTTYAGGASGYGTIFRISRWGDFTIIYNFDSNHGAYPYSPLVQGADGYFYGVTSQGGASGGGVAFKLKPHGNVIVLHNFTGRSDGSNQVGGLMQATDGNFYGTNNVGGAQGWGVLFRMSPMGVFKVLHAFDWATGASPQAAVLQHTNGILYGTTAVGGSATEGTFYSLDLKLAPFVKFLPASASVGSKVDILGQGLFGTTQVSFNGVPATFYLTYDTYLVATVPAGATTGYITVTTPTGTLKSDKQFIVGP
jgi:uncharacterized repeat protein (TIGR03803 family)